MKGNFFKGPITGRHVLYAMLIFFGVIFVVNGVFIYLARSTFTGVSTEDAYHKGLAYNDVIRAARSQHTLGWQVVDMKLTQGGALQVMFLDQEEAPLQGLTVQAEVRRPTTQEYDQTLTLAERAPGLYAGQGEALAQGQWQVVLLAQRGDDAFRVEHRVFLK